MWGPTSLVAVIAASGPSCSIHARSCVYWSFISFDGLLWRRLHPARNEALGKITPYFTLLTVAPTSMPRTSVQARRARSSPSARSFWLSATRARPSGSAANSIGSASDE